MRIRWTLFFLEKVNLDVSERGKTGKRATGILHKLQISKDHSDWPGGPSLVWLALCQALCRQLGWPGLGFSESHLWTFQGLPSSSAASDGSELSRLGILVRSDHRKKLGCPPKLLSTGLYKIQGQQPMTHGQNQSTLWFCLAHKLRMVFIDIYL